MIEYIDVKDEDIDASGRAHGTWTVSDIVVCRDSRGLVKYRKSVVQSQVWGTFKTTNNHREMFP